jgi:hypothetical protein
LFSLSLLGDALWLLVRVCAGAALAQASGEQSAKGILARSASGAATAVVEHHKMPAYFRSIDSMNTPGTSAFVF